MRISLINKTSSLKEIITIGLLSILIYSPLPSGSRHLPAQTIIFVISAGLFILWVVNGGVRRRLKEIRLPLLIFASVFFISSIFSINRQDSLEELIRFCAYFAIFFLVYNWVESIKEVRYLVKGIIFSALVVSAIGYYFFFAAEPGSYTDRLMVATFYRTNDLAGYLLLIIPLALGMLVTAKRLTSYLLYGGSAIIFTISLILTQSRGGWLSLLILLITWLWLMRSLLTVHWKRLVIVILIIIVMLEAIPFIKGRLSPELKQRVKAVSRAIFVDTRENSIAWRLSLLKGGAKIAIDHPFIGTGPDTFGSIYKHYQERPGYYSVHAHNCYLQMAAEIGILGVMAFIFILLTILYKGYRYTKESRGEEAILAQSLLTSFVGSLAHSLVDVDWKIPAIFLLFWIEAGILLAIVHWGEKKEPLRLNLWQRVVLIGFIVLALGLSLANYTAQRQYEAGLRSYSQNELTEAINRFRLASSLAPFKALYHSWLAASYGRTGESEKAILATEKAIILDRYNSFYRNQLGRFYLKENKFPEAMRELERAATINPYYHPEYYNDVARLYLSLGQEEKAIEWYQKAIWAFPLEYIPSYELYSPQDRFQLANSYRELARVYRRRREEKEAQIAEKRAQDLLSWPGMDPRYITPQEAIKTYWQALVENRYEDVVNSFTKDTRENLSQRSFFPHLSGIKSVKVGRFDLVDIRDNWALVRYELTLIFTRANKVKVIEASDLLVLEKKGWKIKGKILERASPK